MDRSLTLVLGGAGSGKSAWAEALTLSHGLPCLYIATARAQDAEMSAKITAHRDRRRNRWTTVEAPDDLRDAVVSVETGVPVLVDCATMWLSNRLLEGADMELEVGELLDALANCRSHMTVVSNELGMGVVPDNALARRFRNLQGQFNRRLAERSDRVVAVMAGLPLALKGDLPCLSQ